jgi:carnitine 3-dehydrogenase
MPEIKTAAIIGGGVIGGGWAARLIENGIDVAVFDPAADAKVKFDSVLANAESAFAKLTTAPRSQKGIVRWHDTVAAAAGNAQLIIESVPERPDIKRAVYAEIETTAATDAVITSSTSGIMPTELQRDMQNPERLMVAHPFNPVYLLPLVELVGGEKTDPEYIAWARTFYAEIGMHPLHCRVEIEGFISDRLQEALWREALWLLHDKVATAAEIDAAIAYGPGLRWAQMGTMQTFHLAGGEGGMRAMLAMFGPCLKWPWTKLMDVPELTDEFINEIGDQCETQADGLSPRDLEVIRDDNLIAILQALKGTNWGAGKTLSQYEQRLVNLAQSAANDS